MRTVTDQADPQRCKGATPLGQCRNFAVEGRDLCLVCGKVDDTAQRDRSQYLLTKYEHRKRLGELSDHDNVKSLRDEIAIARMLIEERLNAIDTTHDLLAACGPLNQLLMTVERLVKSAHILEQNLGQLLSRDTVVQLATRLSEILIEVLKEADIPDYVELSDEVFNRFALCAREAQNAEPARGMKMIEARRND